MLVIEELCDKFIEARRVNDRVMSLSMMLEEVSRVVCAHSPQSGKSMDKKKSYDDFSREWTTHHRREMNIGMGDNNGHVGRIIDEFQGAHGGFTIGGGYQEGRMLLLESAYVSPTNGLERLPSKT